MKNFDATDHTPAEIEKIVADLEAKAERLDLVTKALSDAIDAASYIVQNNEPGSSHATDLLGILLPFYKIAKGESDE